MDGDELLVELVRERISECDDEQLEILADLVWAEEARRRQTEKAKG